MNEEEIIERIKDLIRTCNVGIQEHGEYDDLFELDKTALEGILELYKVQRRQLNDAFDRGWLHKDKIRERLNVCKKVYEEEMKPYQREYGLEVTYLSKKEKEELINKRNCLYTQMKTYEMLLEE